MTRDALEKNLQVLEMICKAVRWNEELNEKVNELGADMQMVLVDAKIAFQREFFRREILSDFVYSSTPEETVLRQSANRIDEMVWDKFQGRWTARSRGE